MRRRDAVDAEAGQLPLVLVEGSSNPVADCRRARGAQLAGARLLAGRARARAARGQGGEACAAAAAECRFRARTLERDLLGGW
jgi:hypothetical protein